MKAELERLRDACVRVAAILDSGKRDPTWHETQELENASLEYGRAELRRRAVLADRRLSR